MRFKSSWKKNLVDLVFCASLVVSAVIPGYISNKDYYNPVIESKLKPIIEPISKRIDYSKDVKQNRELVGYIKSNYGYDYEDYSCYYLGYNLLNSLKKLDNPIKFLDSCDKFDFVSVYNICNQLQNQKFCNSLGKELVDDIDDPYGEHGGLVFFKEDNVIFKPYKNPLSDIGDTENDSSYLFSDECLKDMKNAVATYHFHYNPEDLNSGDIRHEASILDWDVASTRAIDGVVITKLKGNRFNVNFYTSNLSEIDLGNYVYNTKNF